MNTRLVISILATKCPWHSGISHTILKIDWGDRKHELSRNGERVRERRYEEIMKYVIRVGRGSSYIFTAHHLDDQIETFLHRLTFNSSLLGLKGISPITPLLPSFLPRPIFILDWELSLPIYLVRPLLSFSKVKGILSFSHFLSLKQKEITTGKINSSV